MAPNNTTKVDLTGVWRFEYIPRNPDEIPLARIHLATLLKQLKEDHGCKFIHHHQRIHIIDIEAPPGFEPKNDGFFKDLDLRDFVVFKEGKRLEDVGGGKEAEAVHWAALREGWKKRAKERSDDRAMGDGAQ